MVDNFSSRVTKLVGLVLTAGVVLAGAAQAAPPVPRVGHRRGEAYGRLVQQDSWGYKYTNRTTLRQVDARAYQVEPHMVSPGGGHFVLFGRGWQQTSEGGVTSFTFAPGRNVQVGELICVQYRYWQNGKLVTIGGEIACTTAPGA